MPKSNRKPKNELLYDFDVGIICGSTNQEIFDEEIARHPGAVKVRYYHSTRCRCGEPECFRSFIQETLCGDQDEGGIGLDTKEMELIFNRVNVPEVVTPTQIKAVVLQVIKETFPHMEIVTND